MSPDDTKRILQARKDEERIPVRYCSDAAILRWLNDERDVETVLEKLSVEERNRIRHDALIANARIAEEGRYWQLVGGEWVLRAG